MLSEELQITLKAASREAQNRRHEYLTLEHLLFALLNERTGSAVIKNCGGDPDSLRKDLEQFMVSNLEKLPKGVVADPESSSGYVRVLQRANTQAIASDQITIEGGNIIAAMYEERNSYAVSLLEKQGISRLDVLNYIAHGISKNELGGDELTAAGGGGPEVYKVLLHNDDYTSMDFVDLILMSVFNKDEPTARQIKLEVHKKGLGVAGVFTYEIAESKINKVTAMARAKEFPLLCTMEKE